MPRAATICLALVLSLPPLLCTGEELDTPDVLLRRAVEVPPDAEGWLRLDVPPALYAFLRHDTDDLRLIDANGDEVDRVTVSAGDQSPARAELSEFARERTAEGAHTVGVMLPGPGRTPARLRLVGGADDAGPVSVSVGVRPDALATLLAAATARSDGEDRVVDLPPFVGRVLRVTDAAGRRVVAEWEPAPRFRAPLSPQVVEAIATARGLEVMLDLRVRRGADLALHVDVQAAGTGPVAAFDGRHPDTRDWRPLRFVRDATEASGHVQGRVSSPDGPAFRWVRLIIPCESPSAARVVSLTADVPARRLWFRSPEAGRVTLLAGLTAPEPPQYPLARSSATWEAGTAVGLEPVPWPVALGPEGALGPGGALGEPFPPGRPVPWAEILSTLLLAGLLLSWIRARSRGGG